jgi:ribose transport system ATP-binding protein
MSAPALKLEDVRRSFGGVRALRGVSFEVVPGEVHALLGENGAGKSTLMAIAAGALAPDAGQVLIGGVELEPSPSAARDLGVAVVYQHPAVVDHLTVAENMVLILPRERRPRLGAAAAWAAEHLAVVEADINPALRGEDLTVAERQMVEIAKAMALDPKVLILDEPTAALNAAEVERLFAQVVAFQRRGTAIVYISHRIPEVMRIADRITVLRNGESRGTFAADGVSGTRSCAASSAASCRPSSRPRRTPATSAPSCSRSRGCPARASTTSPSRCAPARSSAWPAPRATASAR